MNREFYEGFETRDLSLWDGIVGYQGGVSIYAGIAGLNGYCVRVGAGDGMLWRNMAAAHERYYHVKARLTFTSQSWGGLLKFYSGGVRLMTLLRDWNSAIGNWSLCLTNAAGSYVAWAGIPFLQDITYRVEVYHKVHPTAGNLQVRVNGNEQINYHGNTSSGSITTCNKVGLASRGSYDYPYYDDFITDLEEWVGEAHLGFLVPNGAGASSQWTPSSPPGWACVNHTPVSSVDFVKTLAEAVDLYQVTDPPSLGSYVVKGLQQQVIGSLTGSPTAACFRHLLRTGGEISAGERLQLPAGQNPVYRLVMQNPLTGRPFTVEELSNLEIGLKAEV